MALTKIPASLLDTSSGFDLQGNITLGDNEQIQLGDSGDLAIYHDGSNSYVSDEGAGNLIVRGGLIALQNAGSSQNLAQFTDGGAAQLYYAGAEKLATSSTGATVTGNLAVTGNLDITGDINSYNVTDLDVTDQTITLGAGQTEANSGGSGIIIDGSSASILWDETNDEWDFNKKIHIGGETYFDAGTRHYTYDDQANFWSLYTNTDDTFRFNYNGSGDDEIVITTSGTVGINQGSPSSTYKLDVGGPIRSSGSAPSYTLREDDASSQTWLMASYGGTFAVRDTTVSGTAYPFQIEAATPSNTLFLDSSGKVGIGTTSPLSVTKGLHVVHANNEGNPTYTGAEVGIFQRNFNSSQGAAISIVGGSNSESTVNFADKDDANVGQINYQHSTNSMLFRTNDTVQLSMNNTGKMIIAPAGNITKDYRALWNSSSTGTHYVKLYEKSGTTPNKHLHFQMYSENNSEHSVEVKVMLPTYSGFLSNYGEYTAGQGPHVEILAGGLSSQANTFSEIIAVADMSSTNDYTEIWLKIDPPAANTAISIAEFPESEVITATTSDWTTTAPLNIQETYPIVCGQHSINNVQIGQDGKIAAYASNAAGSNTIDSNTIILTKYAAGNGDANQNENTDDIYFTKADFGFPNSAYGVNVVGYFYASNRLSGVSGGSSGHIWRVAGSLDSAQQVAMSFVNVVDNSQSFGGGTNLKIIGNFNSTSERFEFGVTWEYGAGGYGTVTFIGQATEAMG